MKRYFYFSLILITLLIVGFRPVAAQADSETATNIFVGTATTGAGQPIPIDIDPNDIIVRDDGAIGLGYRYNAEGKAKGDVKGHFIYEERGYIFFFNPADPTTFAGSRFDSGVFTLTPKHAGPDIVIADTCGDPCYESGVTSSPMSEIPHDVKRVISKIIGEETGLVPQDGVLTYGFFTFTNDFGTFTGYATPDFRHFAIEITFEAPENEED